MSDRSSETKTVLDRSISLSPAAEAELVAMGFRDPGGRPSGFDPVAGRPLIPKRALSAPEMLNEAYDYAKPSSFTRGIRVELAGASMLFISGTASIDNEGNTVHVGDFEAQCLRTFRNLTGLLVAEQTSWHDVVRTTCYLRDIDRDYASFNEMRTMFMSRIGLDPLPASTGIEAGLCRPDLLVEIEAIVIVPHE